MFTIRSNMAAPFATPPQAAETDPPMGVVGIDSTVEGWSRPLVERQITVLGRLTEAGLNIALAIERRAIAAAEDGAAQAALDDFALAHDRVARAVRRTIALQSERIARLEAPTATPAAGDAATQRKATVGHIVRRLANKQHRPDYTDRIARETRDWLDDENIYGDILAHPISEIVAWICRDLGLSPDWAHLADEAWAEEELQSGAPGFPLKQHQTPDPRPRSAHKTARAASP
jgi:hypothetical protein